MTGKKVTRKSLQQIRDVSLEMAKAHSAGMSYKWVSLELRAWLDLADAADRLDAIQARQEQATAGKPPLPPRGG